MATIFDKIISKEIAAEIVYEDEKVLAFLDVHPHAPGHTLVIPKQAASTLIELDQEYVGPLFEAVKAVMAALQKALKPDGFTVGMNQGQSAGQAIAHLHVHIMPRYEGDGGKNLHSVVNNPPNQALEAIAEKIRGALA
ncbi:MAG: HIT family protein [Candidatus Harrisonbacteria bacterium]|nr:HIT family protein [Candidatus Harrisonbacteria bacterium]